MRVIYSNAEATLSRLGVGKKIALFLLSSISKLHSHYVKCERFLDNCNGVYLIVNSYFLYPWPVDVRILPSDYFWLSNLMHNISEIIYFSSLQKLCVGIFSEFSNNVRPSISRRWFSVYNNKLQYQSKLKVSKMHIHRMNSSSQISPLALFQISLVSSSRRYHDCRRRSSTMFDKDRRGERATILFWSSLPNENFFAAGRVWGCQTGLDSFHTSMTFQNTCILLFASIDNEIW